MTERTARACLAVAILAALGAIVLPAVRLDVRGMAQPAGWTTASLLPQGWRTLRGQPGAFASAMNNVNQAHAILLAGNQRMLQVSGIFRAGPYLAAPLLVAVAFLALGLLLALLRRPGAMALAFQAALCCDVFAVVPLVWIALAARSQRVVLRSLGVTPAAGLRLGPGLFLLPAALVACILLLARYGSAY